MGSHLALAVGLMVLGAAEGPLPELEVTQSKPLDDVGRLYAFGPLALHGRAHRLIFLRGEERLREVGLGDMNLKAVRAFEWGKDVLVVADIGDEGNSGLELYRISGSEVVRLGAADLVGEDAPALEAAIVAQSGDNLVVTFNAKVGWTDPRGAFVEYPNVKLVVKKGKVQLVKGTRSRAVR
jgi:hypothetical protein